METREKIKLDALGEARKHVRCGLNLSVGFGKTKLALDHFQLVNTSVVKRRSKKAKALIAAPTKKIIQSWKDEAKKWNLEHLLKHFTFTTYRSLHKQDIDYDVLYLDECHSLKESHNSWLTGFNGYILGLTGTPPERDGEKKIMVDRYCPIVYSYTMDDAVDENILNDYSITVHLLSLSKEKDLRIEIKDKKTRRVIKSWMTSEVENYNYWSNQVSQSFGKTKMHKSIMRMKAMHTYKTKDDYAKRLLDQSDEKSILFANEQKQADKLCVHSYHSGNKDAEYNMEKFEKGLISKLSCVQQLSEGANIKGLKHGIIMHAYGNNRKGAQRIGRFMRLSPDDESHIDILCFKNTQDMAWVTSALEQFNQDKITWYDTED